MKNIFIVHGHSNEGYRPDEESRARCDLALRLADESSIIILTGGLFDKKQLNVPCCTAMSDYINWEIRDNKDCIKKILVENHSRTTIENAEEIIENFMPNCFCKDDNITIITSSFHKNRITLIWKRLLKDYVLVETCPVSKLTYFKNLPTEMIGMIIAELYFLGIKFPEILFRKIFRNIK